ncbi:MAG: hypothetical protein BGO12_19630 [Verrucomicrobia bacterium 61-8]|nr:MAG: hypothetical protein BGO12_19630 [Verrucomicrobia bacterium 61-8]
MSELIRIENVSKRYRLGAINRGMLVKDIQSWWARKRGKEDPHSIIGEHRKRVDKDGEFWALRNVDLSINAGDTLAVIGRNGAGKSTLLKILSRTTTPTSGQIKTRGRISSLLEVGTGFHPELTGRENVFLNGAILGMSRREVRAKFDQIVEFAEIGEFIDTPVKRYSSGMYVRLAFAVAAHLDPEVLVVDEVLAVGDANFQKKCLGKLNDVNKEGRTVIFVSHNMAMLTTLCRFAVVLDAGQVIYPKGGIAPGVDCYLGKISETARKSLSERSDRSGEGDVRIRELSILNEDMDADKRVYLSGQKVEFHIRFRSHVQRRYENLSFAIGVYHGHSVFVGLLCNELSCDLLSFDGGEGVVVCSMDKLPLTKGMYVLNVIVRENGVIQDWIQEAKVFEVENGDYFGTGRAVPESHGGVLFEQRWELR